MCGRNVLQIGMYLSVELWVEAIFYIHSYIILFICLFVALFLIFVGWQPQLFTSFVLLFVHHFPTVHAAILKKPSPTFRCQDSKACHRRFNAKSNVHSMNNIRVPETFSISVCYRICFGAVRARGGSNRR